MRCDRIDFPPGGIAYRHTHPGPGIRYLLHGELDITTEGKMLSYGKGGAWFEAGSDPVLAEASSHQPTAFVRVMVLPAEWAGSAPSDTWTRQTTPARSSRSRRSTSSTPSPSGEDGRPDPRLRARRPRRRRGFRRAGRELSGGARRAPTTLRSDSSPAATRLAPPTWPTAPRQAHGPTGDLHGHARPGSNPRRGWASTRPTRTRHP